MYGKKRHRFGISEDDEEDRNKLMKELGNKAAGFGKHVVKNLGHIAGAAVGLKISSAERITLASPEDARRLSRKIFKVSIPSFNYY